MHELLEQFLFPYIVRLYNSLMLLWETPDMNDPFKLPYLNLL